jgi:hypothetical protein
MNSDMDSGSTPLSLTEPASDPHNDLAVVDAFIISKLDISSENYKRAIKVLDVANDDFQRLLTSGRVYSQSKLAFLLPNPIAGLKSFIYLRRAEKNLAEKTKVFGDRADFIRKWMKSEEGDRQFMDFALKRSMRSI